MTKLFAQHGGISFSFLGRRKTYSVSRRWDYPRGAADGQLHRSKSSRAAVPPWKNFFVGWMKPIGFRRHRGLRFRSIPPTPSLPRALVGTAFCSTGPRLRCTRCANARLGVSGGRCSAELGRRKSSAALWRLESQRRVGFVPWRPMLNNVLLLSTSWYFYQHFKIDSMSEYFKLVSFHSDNKKIGKLDKARSCMCSCKTLLNLTNLPLKKTWRFDSRHHKKII